MAKRRKIERCPTCTQAVMTVWSPDFEGDETVCTTHYEPLEALWLREQVDTLFEAIKHGDKAHQKWLKQKLKEHFK